MTKIARVEAFPLSYPEPHDSMRLRCVTLARVEADDGAVGWGECISQLPESALATATVIERGFAPIMVGTDPTHVRRQREKMRSRSAWYGNGGIAAFAISAVDIALWDLTGKLANLPVHALLGGKQCDRLRACASVILNTLDLGATVAEFEEYRARGFTAFKGGWGQVPEAGFGTDEARDLKLARAVRDAIGPDAALVLDVSAQARWSRTHAVRMAKQLEEFELTWLEDALPFEDHVGYRRLRAATSLPLGTGERAWTVHEYRRLVRSQSVDVVLVDPGRVEGLTGMHLVAEEAGADGVRFAPHSWSSALNTAATLHVLAAATNGMFFELKPNTSPMHDELAVEAFTQIDGYTHISDAPGLGIEIDEETVRKYRIE